MKKNRTLISLLLMTLFATPAAYASVDLIAMGSLSGSFSDLSTQTSGLLENGVAGNLLGGLGSGLAYAGNNTFIATPDRGPNARRHRGTGLPAEVRHQTDRAR